jgi:peptide/nickel transport system ATP-binding protein
MTTTTADAAQPVLQVEHLDVRFYVRASLLGSRPIAAVTDVSLELARGETVAVVGESGSGKTTLGRATLRLVPATSGRVVFEGQDIAALRGRELLAFRRRAQVIFQDPFSSLSPYMRVGDLVAEPLTIHGPRERTAQEERMLAALEQVKLRPAVEFAEKYPHTLSGGQRQRVSIARAMVLEPDYLVADEPVSMIDASSRAEILYLLSELQARRALTFLYITHDLASARHFADRIAVMYAGRIVELAPATQLIEAAAHPYTRALLAAVPEPDPGNRLRQRPVVGGEPPDPGDLPSGCAFVPRCPLAIAGTCERIVPPLIELTSGHHVACHLYPAPADGDALSASAQGRSMGVGVMGTAVGSGEGDGDAASGEGVAASAEGVASSGNADASGEADASGTPVAAGAGDAASGDGGTEAGTYDGTGAVRSTSSAASR